MGSEKGQRKVRLTIGKMPGVSSGTFGCHIPFGFGSLEPLPYWGTSDTSGIYLWYAKSYGRTYCQTPTGVSEVVTVFVEGYSLPLVSDSGVAGDIFDMADQTGSARYLTFDPPPMGTWIQRHSNRSRNRVLCRRRSLGGAKC